MLYNRSYKDVEDLCKYVYNAFKIRGITIERSFYQDLMVDVITLNADVLCSGCHI